MKKRLTLAQALMWILLSVFVITLPSYSALKAYLKRQRQKATDPMYTIVSLIQTGPQREALHTDYLAELMGIAINRPQSVFHFDCKLAEKRLLSSPVIKEAYVETAAPSSVYVDYTVRQPLAWISDYTNTAIDEEKILFPVCPFFTPKKLPEIYLGLAPFENPSNDPNISSGRWHAPLEGKKIQLAFDVLKLMVDSPSKEAFPIQRIDVSNAFSPSYGTREIVVILEDEVFRKEGEKEITFVIPRFLRLSTKNYAQELGNYLKLREELLQDESKELVMSAVATDRIVLAPKIIDFRISHLAFIEKTKKLQ